LISIIRLLHTRSEHSAFTRPLAPDVSNNGDGDNDDDDMDVISIPALLLRPKTNGYSGPNRVDFTDILLFLA
jgi:hypothetical protein